MSPETINYYIRTLFLRFSEPVFFEILNKHK